MLRKSSFLIFGLLTTSLATAQNNIGRGEVADTYKKNCAVCHGENLEGGLGSNLIDDVWTHATNDAEITKVINEGLPAYGMTPFKSILSPEDVRSLVIYIREVKQLAEQETFNEKLRPDDGVFSSEDHSFRLEDVASVEGIPWAIAFLPGGDLLVTLRKGEVWRTTPGEEPQKVKGIPEVWQYGQGGLLEIALHPDYAENGWIYLGLSALAHDREKNRGGMTKVVRGKLDGLR